MEITGYKYNTESEAIAARKQCADFYGLPITPDDVLKYYVNYQEANLNTPIFWYIVFDEGVREILGEPETFDVVFEELIEE
jgi:hypothetical protein